MFTWYKELSVLLTCITCPSSLSDIELSNIDTVRELLVLSIKDDRGINLSNIALSSWNVN